VASRALAALPVASSLLSPNVFVSLDAVAAAGRSTVGAVLACWEHPRAARVSKATGTAAIIVMVNSILEMKERTTG
jgi:hypothetical protein